MVWDRGFDFGGGPRTSSVQRSSLDFEEFSEQVHEKNQALPIKPSFNLELDTSDQRSMERNS